MMHICIGNLTIIDSDNGLSPLRRQAIIWSNAGILLIGPLGTNFREILMGIQSFSFNKMHLKMTFAKWRPFCLSALMCYNFNIWNHSHISKATEHVWKLHFKQFLTHWGQVTHICVIKLSIIGSDNGLSPDRRQAIIWTNAGILIIGPLGANFN